MHEAARKVILFTKGKSRAEIQSDEKLILALSRLIEIIGEAASRVSKELQECTSPIAWTDIIGTRNRLIHAYFDVDTTVLWHIIQNDLGPLITELESIIDSESGEQQQKLF